MPGDLDKVFFTLGGAEAIENAIKLARHHTGRYKVLARYRAYHGATMGAMTLTGDPRRWANEPGLVGVVRYPDTHRWGEPGPRPVEESLQGLEDVIRYEGPHTIAASCVALPRFPLLCASVVPPGTPAMIPCVNHSCAISDSISSRDCELTP